MSVQFKKQYLFFFGKYFQFKLETLVQIWLLMLCVALLNGTLAAKHPEQLNQFCAKMSAVVLITFPFLCAGIAYLNHRLRQSIRFPNWCFEKIVLESYFQTLRPIRSCCWYFEIDEMSKEIHYYGIVVLSIKNCKRILTDYSWIETEIKINSLDDLICVEQQYLQSDEFFREHCPKGKTGNMFFLPSCRQMLFDLRSPLKRTAEPDSPQ
jgi:hypothetical protein